MRDYLIIAVLTVLVAVPFHLAMEAIDHKDMWERGMESELRWNGCWYEDQRCSVYLKEIYK